MIDVRQRARRQRRVVDEMILLDFGAVLRFGTPEMLEVAFVGPDELAPVGRLCIGKKGRHRELVTVARNAVDDTVALRSALGTHEDPRPRLSEMLPEVHVVVRTSDESASELEP